MEDLYYKWNRDDFKKVFYENNLKSTFIENDNNNCVIVLVDSFEEMKGLFNGRSRWPIANEKRYWELYVSNKGRKQYVYADFDKDEKSKGCLFAFTYDPAADKFTDAATMDDFGVAGTDDDRDTTIRYILEHVFSLYLGNFLKLETPSTRTSEMKREISELEDKYGVKLIIKKEEDC